VAGSQYRCSDCHFDRFCDDRRGSFDLPEEEEEDSLGYPPWDLNARGHKLYNCGIKNRLLEETLKQAREKGIPFSTAKEIAAIALRYAVTARFDVRGYGVEEATRIALAVGRDTIKFGLGLSYTSTSNDTTSTSVGGAGGEY
jgi:hypothetical protein